MSAIVSIISTYKLQKRVCKSTSQFNLLLNCLKFEIYFFAVIECAERARNSPRHFKWSGHRETYSVWWV